MDDTDKMCVYEGYNKARDCRQETLVKYKVHRYMNTNEWINAAKIFPGRGACAAGLKRKMWNNYSLLLLLWLLSVLPLLEGCCCC
jgi:hypothetical protein